MAQYLDTVTSELASVPAKLYDYLSQQSRKELFLTFTLAFLVISLIHRTYIAFFGPLSHHPGPLLLKFTYLPEELRQLGGRAFANRIAMHAQYGPIVRVGPNVLSFGGVEACKQICVTKDLPKNEEVYAGFRPASGVANMFDETDRAAHKAKRRLMSNGFSVAYLKNIHPLIMGVVDTFCTNMEQKIDEGAGEDGMIVTDFYHPFSHMTTDVIGETAFGGTFNLITSKTTEFADMLNWNFYKTVLGMVCPPLRHLGFDTEEPLLNTMIEASIRKRRAENASLHPTPDKKRKDIFQHLLETHDSNPSAFPYHSFRHELILLVVAGGDTTSRALIFTLRLLLEHPQHLRTLEVEILAALVAPNGKPLPYTEITDAHLQKLPFLNACLYETLRLYHPMVGGAARVADKDYDIAGTFVPRATHVIANPHCLHLDPTMYPNPLKWDPTRWLPVQPEGSEYEGGLVERSRDWFWPFGQGGRNCIGKVMAWTEMRMGLGMVVLRFRMEEVGGQGWGYKQFLTLHFDDKRYLVKVGRRKFE